MEKDAEQTGRSCSARAIAILLVWRETVAAAAAAAAPRYARLSEPAETTGGCKGKRFSRYLGHIVSSRVDRDVSRTPRTNEDNAAPRAERENPIHPRKV